MQRPRQEAVPREDRAQHREAVERRVGSKEEDDHRHGDDEVEADGEGVEDRAGELPHGRLVLHMHLHPVLREVGATVGVDQFQPGQVGEHDDAAEHRDRDPAEKGEGGGCVLALRLPERGDAVGDRLHAGECGAAGREGPRDQNDQGDPGEVVVERRPDDAVPCGRCLQVLVQPEDPEQPPHGHSDHPDHEAVGRDREHRTGFAHAPQVHRHQQHDQARCPHTLVPGDEREDRLRVLHAGGDRDSNGEDVVDHKGAGHRQAGARPQVHRCHLVVATTGGVGVHRLPVGQHDDRHHHGDGECDLPGKEEAGDAGKGKGEQDLVRGVGNGAQGVGRKDRQRDPLGEECLPQLGTRQLAPHQQSLHEVGGVHEWSPYATMRVCRPILRCSVGFVPPGKAG